MALVSTMVISVSSTTGVISVVPTLPGGAAAPAFMVFYFRPYGVGNYKPQIMTLSGTTPQMRLPLPWGRSQFFIRVVDINAAVYDSPPVEMFYANTAATLGVDYTEVHVPERSIIGEKSQAHAMSYKLKSGAGIPSSFVTPIRVATVPDGTLATVGAYVQTIYHFASPSNFAPGNEGTRTHSFILGA